MKRSISAPAAGALRALTFAAATIDLTARLSVPGAVVAVAYGQQTLAIGLAAMVNILAVARGSCSGRLLEHSTTQHLNELIRTLQRVPLHQLRIHASDQSAAVLVAAAQRCASVRALSRPRLFADLSGLAITSGLVVLLAPSRWLGLGAIALLLLAPPLLWLQRKQRHVERVAFEHASELIVGTEALFQGGEALRAHGQDHAMAQHVSERACNVARQKRAATQLSALIALIPLGLTLLALSPAAAWLQQQEAGKIVSLGALGAAWIALFLGALRAGGDIYRSKAEREAHQRFLNKGTENPAATGNENPSLRMREALIRFDGISICHNTNSEGSARQTPAALSYDWLPHTNLALLGPNGTGKSSLVHAFLGLVHPTEGRILLDDTETRTSAIAHHVAYLPQRAFLTPSKSIRWHYQALCGSCDDTQALQALERLGIPATVDTLQRPLGQFSGGEQARIQLARLLLPHHGSHPSIVILDEPEANLDASGRALLFELLVDWPQAPRRILIAHRPEIVPEAYSKLNIRAAYAPCLSA